MPDYRRVARELALRVLYEVDVGRQPPRDALNRAIEQLAAGVRAGITMAVKEAQAATRPREVGPAVFTSRTVLRERDRVRRAVIRAVERTAAGFDTALVSLFVEAGRAGGGRDGSDGSGRIGTDRDVNGALWALADAARRPMELLDRTLQSSSLPRPETAPARRIASDAVDKMRHALVRRLDIALTTARMVAQLVRGALRHRDDMDAHLGALTGDWPLERQSAADRNIMRLAAYEIAYRPDTPAPVVLNEAVELAKRYGTEESGRFVNGVLAAFAARHDGLGADRGSAGASPSRGDAPYSPDHEEGIEGMSNDTD